MRRRDGAMIWLLGLAAGMASGVLSPVLDAAQRAAESSRIEAHLAAGEFAPALALARRAASREQRDGWLRQIAVAQARAGDRRAACQTASEISEDRTRRQAFAEVADQPLGGHGGGAAADFDSLIDLITSTIAPTTWDEVGGPGSIAPFPSGVYIDGQGVLRRALSETPEGSLTSLRDASAAAHAGRDLRRSSPLRKISLPRLEKQVQFALALGRQPTEAMQVLAGLERIQYVFVYPESDDLVLAGPAGDWRIDKAGRVLSVRSGLPVIRLDDLVVVFRHMLRAGDARFGCLITPRQEGLARIQEFLRQSSRRPLRPGERKAWLEQLRSQLGLQEIEVYGLEPGTRAARVMVEADYRMKLVGMGLEEAVPGVVSYLDSLRLGPGDAPPPMGVLRWWFALDYDAVQASPDRLAFAIHGQGVKVLSENERLTAAGERVHTGQSEELNRQFARSFTQHFEALAAKYPIYAELRNIAELALVGALIRHQALAEKAAWHMTCFGDPESYRVPLSAAPRTVETVVNHRVFHQKTVVAGVSGGVAIDPAPLVSAYAVAEERGGTLAAQRTSAAPAPLQDDAWWWD